MLIIKVVRLQTESVAINLKYLEAVETACKILADAIVSDMEEALIHGARLDRTVQHLTRVLGQTFLPRSMRAFRAILPSNGSGWGPADVLGEVFEEVRDAW